PRGEAQVSSGGECGWGVERERARGLGRLRAGFLLALFPRAGPAECAGEPQKKRPARRATRLGRTWNPPILGMENFRPLRNRRLLLLLVYIVPEGVEAATSSVPEATEAAGGVKRRTA